MSESNQNPSDPTANAPQVSFKTPRIPGVLPQGIRTYAVIALTCLMLATIYFSPGSSKKITAQPGPSQTQMPATGREIEQYKALLAAETLKLQANRQRLERAKTEAEVAEKATLGPQALPTTPSQNIAYGRSGGFSAIPPERLPVEAERQLQALDHAKRDERSLYASNIALTYRNDLAAPPTRMRIDEPATTPNTEKNAEVKTSPVAKPRDVDQRRLRADDPSLQEAEGPLYRLFEGTIVETVLTNRLDGNFAGPVNVMVTTNVYSHDSQQLLIPQGTRVLGQVEKVSGVGQQRLAVFFHRLIMPDGYVHSLDKFQALNQTGETGLRDQVNHHYVQIFGASLAIGAIAGVAQAGANYGSTSNGIDAYQRGTSQNLSQSALHILDRFLNVLPTFTVREGHRIKIVLTDDLLLPEYAGHKLPANL